MDNSNSISGSIFQSNEPSLITSTNNGTGFFDSLKNISITTWILIIVILAFSGFNIFVYLAKGSQDITNFFGPFVEKIFGTTAAITGEVVDVSAEGAKAVVNTTAGAIDTGLTAVQNITPQGASSTLPNQKFAQQQPDVLANSSLNKTLNTAQQHQTSGQDYEANEASSSVHLGGGQSGWCFIGEDRGFRSCSQVNTNDKCMSGDIFPSQEICVNPSLRS
jgi:hypothetical protein